MNHAKLRLKAIVMAKVKMAGSYKAQGKTQVKQGIKRIHIYRVSRQAMAMTPKPGKKPAMKPSAKEMGLGVKRESIYDKMLMATTRQLNASTGAQYSRYTVETNYVH